MTDNIVERLRRICDEAADEIERLAKWLQDSRTELVRLGAEIERLKQIKFGEDVSAGAVKRMIDEIGQLRADYSRLEKVTMAEIGRLRAENEALKNALRASQAGWQVTAKDWGR